jgi:hypothetical protein
MGERYLPTNPSPPKKPDCPDVSKRLSDHQFWVLDPESGKLKFTPPLPPPKTPDYIKLVSSFGPFWRWKINLGVGKCEVECEFCYNLRWDWAKQEWVCRPYNEKALRNQFSNFEWVPGESKQYIGQHDIMMCTTGDPFAPMNRMVAYDILEMAAEYPQVGDHLRVLTKQAVFGDYGWRVLPQKALYGASICTLDEKISKEVMPNASTPSELLWHLYIASKMHMETFISAEPMLIGMDLCDLMEMVYPENEIESLKEIFIGPMNHGFGRPEFAMSDADIIEQVRKLIEFYNIKVYVKKETKGVKALQDEGLVPREGLSYAEVTA